MDSAGNLKNILFEKEDAVAIITLNRPDVMNAWTLPMVEEMVTALDEVGSDESTRALIITGAGKAFSAGFDMKELMKEKMAGEVSWADTNGGRKILGNVTTDSIAIGIHNLRKPVIAAVNGIAMGIGTSYALACDIRIASEKARFNMAFVDRGLIPEGGVTYFLPRLIGLGRACKAVFAGETIGAEEAERIGLVEEIVPHDMLMKKSLELAGRIAEKPPLAIALSKQTLYRGATENDLLPQLNREFYLQSTLIESDDVKEGVSSFLEKRKPVFRGR